MKNLREVNDDILKDWFIYRDEDISALKSNEDKKHWIYLEEISEKILKNIPKQNRKYIEKQLEQLDNNFFDYITYWNEKYYRNGFCDGIELLNGCFD